MNSSQITYVELIFTTIDREILPKHVTDELCNNTCNFNMRVYLRWLLNRWILLRNNIDHYPERINHKSYYQILKNV